MLIVKYFFVSLKYGSTTDICEWPNSAQYFGCLRYSIDVFCHENIDSLYQVFCREHAFAYFNHYFYETLSNNLCVGRTGFLPPQA